jgi:hypothetical protein
MDRHELVASYEEIGRMLGGMMTSPEKFRIKWKKESRMQ